MGERKLNRDLMDPGARTQRGRTGAGLGGGRPYFLTAAVLVLVLLGGRPTVCQGAGFALIQQGTAAMAQGNAFVAEADDPSAIYYNPAGLTQIKRPQAYVATFLNFPDREYKGPGGGDAETKPRMYHTGAFYLVYPLHDHVVLGLGYFSPFGLGTDWPGDWAGRYITTFSQLKTYTLNPVISLKLTDKLSVAGGVNFLYSDVQLRRKVPIIPQPLLDGKSDLEGSGTGIGANFGVLYEPLQGVKLGLAYRTHIQVEHDGRLVLSFPSFLRGIQPRSVEGSANLVFPPSITFGLSVNRFKPFTFNVDATWTGWSTYKSLDLKLDQPVLVNGRFVTNIATEKNWHDAWALRFGVGYQLKENMKIRAGYTFDMTPVPSSTLEPQVPDSNRHIFALGSELKVWRLTLAFAYNFILNEPRDKDNLFAINNVPLPEPAQVNGTYRSQTHSVGLSTTFHF